MNLSAHMSCSRSLSCLKASLQHTLAFNPVTQLQGCSDPGARRPPPVLRWQQSPGTLLWSKTFEKQVSEELLMHRNVLLPQNPIPTLPEAAPGLASKGRAL